jgi:lysophospholipase L1-like esterase
VLQADLGENFRIVEEGLGGRSTIYTREGEEWKSGEMYLKPCLHSHRPLDLVIIMLGTNDLQINKSITEEDLPVGISRLVDIIQETPNVGRDQIVPKILIVAPIEIRPSAPEGRVLVYDKFRREIGRELSLKFPEVYEKVAREKGCYFLNAALYAQPGPADGVHFTPESQIRLGHALAEYIKKNIYPEV